MSYDREAEVSSYNAMSACKSTLESSGVGVQFDAYDIWFEQLGTPRGLANRNRSRLSTWELKPSYDLEAMSWAMFLILYENML